MQNALWVGGSLFGLAALAVVGLPRSFLVERHVDVARPVSEVFAAVTDLTTRQHWTAWAEKEPDAKYVYEGTTGKAGSSMAWAGKDMGVGDVTIVAVEQDRSVETRLRFKEPFEMVSRDSFRFAASANGGTRITWTNEGDLQGPQRVMGLFMDRMIGPDYERGLQRLKAHLEKTPSASTAAVHNL